MRGHSCVQYKYGSKSRSVLVRYTHQKCRNDEHARNALCVAALKPYGQTQQQNKTCACRAITFTLVCKWR